jgi:hypothetical protein
METVVKKPIILSNRQEFPSKTVAQVNLARPDNYPGTPGGTFPIGRPVFTPFENVHWVWSLMAWGSSIGSTLSSRNSTALSLTRTTANPSVERHIVSTLSISTEN